LIADERERELPRLAGDDALEREAGEADVGEHVRDAPSRGAARQIVAHGNDACPVWNVCSAGADAPSQVAPPGSSSSSCPAISGRAFTTIWPATFCDFLYVKP
jgi:hypothetical protein